MTFQPGAMLYTQSFGSRPENIEVPHYDTRVPSVMDWNYPIGKIWIWPNNSAFMLLSIVGQLGVNTATWVQLISASGNVLSVTGTPNQITSTNLAGIVNLSIPVSFIAPGSIASTTSILAGTTLTANASILAGTTLTATLGNITATNGNLVLSTAGNKLVINAATPASSSVGTSVAMVTGVVTITSSAIAALSKFIYSRRTAGGTPGNISITAQSAGSVTLTSTNVTETSTFDYLIIN